MNYLFYGFLPFYFNSVVYYLFGLAIVGATLKFKFNSFGILLFLLIVVLLCNFLVFDFWRDGASLIEYQRFLFWCLIALLISTIDFSKELVAYLTNAGRLFAVGCLISLVIYIFYKPAMAVLYEVSMNTEGEVAHIVDGDLNDIVERFFVPGINSNTIAIMSSIFMSIFVSTIYQNGRKLYLKLFDLLVVVIYLISGLLTFSRMFYIFLALILGVQLFYFGLRRLLFFFIPSTIMFFSTEVGRLGYYRFLNLVDAIIGSDLSEGKTKSTSDRTKLLDDSLDWIFDNPFGGRLAVMERTHPGASGEHNVFLFLANNFGIFVSLIFFFYTTSIFYQLFKIRRLALKLEKINYAIILSITLILFFSSFVAPSYYILLLYYPLLYQFVSKFKQSKI